MSWSIKQVMRSELVM